MLVHHTSLKSLQKHSLSLLNCEYRFDLIRCFDQQVLRTLLTLRIDDFLTLLFFLRFNRLLELNGVHGRLAETGFIYHFVSSNSVFLGWVMIWIMFKNLTLLLLIAHFLIFFNCFFGSLLEIFWMIMNTNKVINSCLWFDLWLLFQLWKWNLWNQLLIFNVKGAWPFVSVVNIKVLELWVSGFEILEMINHNLNKLHLE